MLYEEVSASDLAIQILLVGELVLVQVGGVVLSHILFERLAVRVLRRLPSRLLGVRVEVVRQILAVGMPHLLIRIREKIDHVDKFG